MHVLKLIGIGCTGQSNISLWIWSSRRFLKITADRNLHLWTDSSVLMHYATFNSNSASFCFLTDLTQHVIQGSYSYFFKNRALFGGIKVRFFDNIFFRVTKHTELKRNEMLLHVPEIHKTISALLIVRNIDFSRHMGGPLHTWHFRPTWKTYYFDSKRIHQYKNRYKYSN